MKLFYVGVKAIIESADGVLLLNKKGMWDAPGGRLDDGEPVLTALHRELKEELPGIKDIKVGKFLYFTKIGHDLPDGNGLCLVFYQVSATIPNPIELSPEHQSYAWVPREYVYMHESGGLVGAVNNL